MRLKQALILLLLAIFCPTVFLYKRMADDKAAKIFGNMAYHIDDALGKKDVTLVNGGHKEWELDVRYDGRYVYDDFNHDKSRDAAVMLIENTGGNQDWYTLAFLMNNGERLIHRATIYLDDRAIINSLRAKNGRVFIDMYVHQPDDCNGGPSKRLREWYEYPGRGVFTSRIGTYIFGEIPEGIRGEPG